MVAPICSGVCFGFTFSLIARNCNCIVVNSPTSSTEKPYLSQSPLYIELQSTLSLDFPSEVPKAFLSLLLPRRLDS